jgi:hypothetical protein
LAAPNVEASELQLLMMAHLTSIVALIAVEHLALEPRVPTL